MDTHIDTNISTEVAEPAVQVTDSVELAPHVPAPTQEQEVSEVAPITSEVDSQDTNKDEDDTSGTVEEHVVYPVAHRVIEFNVVSDTTFQVMKDDFLTKFKVSSSLVTAASPIWRTILYGPDVEAPTAVDLVVNIDADPKALETLFRIIHYQFCEVPCKPSLDELYELTLLTSRYKCTHLVYPWAQKWAFHFSTIFSLDDQPQHCHKVVWIAWELGDRDLFRDMVKAMVVNSKVDAEGNLVNISGHSLEEMTLPPGIPEIVSAARTATLEKILAAVNAPIVALTQEGRHKHDYSFSREGRERRKPDDTYCRMETNKTHCEAMLLGSAMPHLIRAGLYPVPNAGSFSESIAQLKKTLDSIRSKNIVYVGADYFPHKNHNECSLGFDAAAQRYIETMHMGLQRHHADHIKSQAMISGLNADFDVSEGSSSEGSIRVYKSGNTIIKDTWFNTAEKTGRRARQSGKPTGDQAWRNNVKPWDQ